MPGIADITAQGAELAAARVICVVLHGRGQSPAEMQAALVARLTTPGVAYALPLAAGHVWYHARAVDPLTDDARADLAQSLGDLAQAIDALRTQAPGRPLVLAGFSQGACLAVEHALAGTTMPDALVAFTGCRVGVAGDDRPMVPAPGLPAYLTAGDADPWIPLDAFAATTADLGRAGVALRADIFPGRPHEIADAEAAMLDAILSDLAAGRPPAMGAAR
jgi:phospholipase/carboxylesterase